MKTLFKKTSHIRSAHTWKDIGGLRGLILDAVFFVFVLLAAGLTIVLGFIFLLLDYAAWPFLALLSHLKGHAKANPEETTEDVIYR